MYTQGFLCLFYWKDFQYCLLQHAYQIVQQECVGIVACLVKVANSQTDRLAKTDKGQTIGWAKGH